MQEQDLILQVSQDCRNFRLFLVKFECPSFPKKRVFFKVVPQVAKALRVDTAKFAARQKVVCNGLLMSVRAQIYNK